MSHQTTAILVVSGSLVAVAGYIIYENERRKKLKPNTISINSEYYANPANGGSVIAVAANVISGLTVNPHHAPVPPPTNPHGYINSFEQPPVRMPMPHTTSLSDSQLDFLYPQNSDAQGIIKITPKRDAQGIVTITPKRQGIVRITPK